MGTRCECVSQPPPPPPPPEPFVLRPSFLQFLESASRGGGAERACASMAKPGEESLERGTAFIDIYPP